MKKKLKVFLFETFVPYLSCYPFHNFSYNCAILFESLDSSWISPSFILPIGGTSRTVIWNPLKPIWEASLLAPALFLKVSQFVWGDQKYFHPRHQVKILQLSIFPIHMWHRLLCPRLILIHFGYHQIMQPSLRKVELEIKINILKFLKIASI